MSMELLGVQNLRTTKARNKQLRFRWGKEGERYEIIPKNGSYELNKVKNSGDNVGLVRLNTYPAFLYIPVLHSIEYEGYVSVFREDKGNYIVRPSTEKEIETHAKKKTVYTESGYVKWVSGPFVHIIKDDMNRISTTGYVRMHVVAGKKAYIEVTPITWEEAEQLPDLAGAATPYGGWDNLRFAEEYTYYTKITETILKSKNLPVPVSFLRKVEAHDKDKFFVWFKDNGTMVIEPNPLICDGCKRPISRYHDNANNVYICKQCHKSLIDLDIIMGDEDIEEIRDLKQVADTLNAIQLRLEELLSK